MYFSRSKLEEKVRELGFNLFGVTPARPSPRLNDYLHWIEQGYQGAMGYLAREDRIIRRQDPQVILKGAESFIVVGMDYRSFYADEAALTDPNRGRIASYAWDLDYHDIMEDKLDILARWLQEETGQTAQSRVYVDTGAILEKSHAQQAGMGFIGKNTLLIHPQRGSYFFLGSLISNIEIDPYDEPHRETMCGQCTRCQTACPTDAFVKPYVLDARKCISYHTIENKGWIDFDLRSQFGNWVYGCDICQDVCPFQRFTVETDEIAYRAKDENHVMPKLDFLLALDEPHFKEIYARSPIYRIKRERLVRNACIASGNSGNLAFVDALKLLLEDPSLLVRGHALWALWRLIGTEANSHLEQGYRETEDAILRKDIVRMLA